MQAVWAQKLIPRLLDWHLGQSGYQSQTTAAPNEQRADILFEALPGDPGAHGRYRDRERGPDLQMRLRTHPRAVLAITSVLAAGLLALARRR